jgi:hypothetical protein
MNLLGIVINPLTKELVISLFRGSERTSKIWIYRLDESDKTKQSIGYSILNHSTNELDYVDALDPEASFFLSGFPRIHASLDNDDEIGKGYGTALYASSTLRFAKEGIDYDKIGISSSSANRTEYSNKWWEKAVRKNIAEEVTQEANLLHFTSLRGKENDEALGSKFKKLIEDATKIPSDKIIGYDINYIYKTSLPFTYNILRTSSAINAGWIGLHTTENISGIEEMNKSNTVLCNIDVFINANWKKITKPTKDMLFKLIVDLSGRRSSKKDISDLEASIYSK